MYNPRFVIIGLSDSRKQEFTSEILNIISEATLFSGGKRHHEIVADLLPKSHLWIDVTVPLTDVYDKYRQYSGPIVVFASGDPLFYGFGGTLKREFPLSDICVYPTFNSLQTLAHRISQPYQDMINVSVTGRPWKNLDDALIRGHKTIGILTDRKKGPSEIAARMLQYGYNGYSMTIGESLGNNSDERITTMTPEQAVSHNFSHPNCLILQNPNAKPHRLGIPEREFYHLDGREKMITKMPVRLVSIAMLDLANHHTLWDIGFCTGSVSIEARLMFPHLDIIAFEKREECKKLLQLNCERLGAPGITGVIGDFFDIDLSKYPRPDAVFIGGHGGRLTEMLDIIYKLLIPGGIIVFNSVSEDSCSTFIDSVTSLGHIIAEQHKITLDTHNPITILKAI